MRLFIAVQLSDEMKTAVIGTMHGLKQAGVKGSYVPAANLHMTLAFIGEVPDADGVQAVKDAMRAIRYKPFRLSLAGLGTCGDRLWVGLKGNQGLSALSKSVREALDASAIEYDRKGFTPHITVVRKMSGKWQQVPPAKGDMMVKRVSLMRSDMKDGKRVYKEIFAV